VTPPDDGPITAQVPEMPALSREAARGLLRIIKTASEQQQRHEPTIGQSVEMPDALAS
jgi:hypothetical protein